MFETPGSRDKVRQGPSQPGKPCSLVSKENMIMIIIDKVFARSLSFKDTNIIIAVMIKIMIKVLLYRNPSWLLPPVAFCQDRIPGENLLILTNAWNIKFSCFVEIILELWYNNKLSIDPDVEGIFEALELVGELDHLLHVTVQRFLKNFVFILKYTNCFDFSPVCWCFPLPWLCRLLYKPKPSKIILIAINTMNCIWSDFQQQHCCFDLYLSAIVNSIVLSHLCKESILSPLVLILLIKGHFDIVSKLSSAKSSTLNLDLCQTCNISPRDILMSS